MSGLQDHFKRNTGNRWQCIHCEATYKFLSADAEHHLQKKHVTSVSTVQPERQVTVDDSIFHAADVLVKQGRLLRVGIDSHKSYLEWTT